MAKNLNLPRCYVNIEDDVITLEYVNEYGENKIEKLSDLIQELSLGELNISVKKWKPKKESNLPQIYKYKCQGCENEIKSKFDKLNIKCNDCNINYTIGE